MGLGKLFGKGLENLSPTIQVDAWGAFVPSRGSLVERLRENVIKEVSERELPNLEITAGSLDIANDIVDKWFRTGEPREYIFFTYHLGKTAVAMIALRIAKRGTKDMELAWRLFEGNPAKGVFKAVAQGAKIYVGAAVAGAGLLTSIFGFGSIAIPIGLEMVSSGMGGLGKNKGARHLTTEQQLDARILVQTIDYCLMLGLEKEGVSSDELRILQASQIEGVGRLGNAEH